MSCQQCDDHRCEEKNCKCNCHDDIETYSPTIRKEKTLKLEGTDYESKIDSIANEEGVIKMRLNADVIIQRVSNQLYKSSYSAFRELYNNCCYHGYIDETSYVKVSLDTDTRKFVIQDFNSKGISGVVFNKVLTVLGTSSNTDRSKGGKFGLGFNAYPLLSDVVILETRCVNGETYSVIGKGGMQFQKSAQPNLEKTGTKLSMTLREDINYNRLVDKIIECARTSGVKTYFELKSANSISGFESGLHTLEQESYEEMFEKNRDQSKSYLTSSISNDDYEVHLAIAVNKDGHLTNTRSKNFHLINSPIEVRIDQGDVNTKYYHTNSSDSDEKKKYKTLMENYKSQRIDEIRFERVIVNMKNEEMFEARGDREEATEQTEQKLREIIVSLYNETLKKIKPCHKLEDWFDHEHKYFIGSDNQDVLDLIDDQSKPLNKFLNTQVMVYGDKKYNGKQLKYFIEKADKYFYVHKKDNRVLDLCNEHFNNFLVMMHPDKDIFKPDKYNTSNANLFKNTIGMLKRNGFVEAKQYLKDNNIKAIRSQSGIEREKGDIAIHRSLEYSDYWSSGLRTTSSRVKLDSDEFKNLVKENKLIQVTNFALYRSALKLHNSNIQITTQQKELIGIVKTLDDIEKEFTEKTFKTNHGDLNIKEILNFEGKINLNYFGNTKRREDRDPEQIKRAYDEQIKALPYIPKNELYIFEYKNSDELFLIALLICKKLNASSPTTDILEFHYNEAIINFYRNKFQDLENSLTFSKNISNSNFESIFEYEKFLFTVRDFEMQVTDPLIKKFVASTINFENYEEIKKDALALQEKVKIPKPVQTINRSKEYLS